MNSAAGLPNGVSSARTAASTCPCMHTRGRDSVAAKISRASRRVAGSAGSARSGDNMLQTFSAMRERRQAYPLTMFYKRFQTAGVPVTIKDVARAAGVSPSTVSRALTAPDVVQPETRARVQQAAASLGYQPNRAARGLITGRTG